MSARVLMLQGVGSDVGKTTLVAGLCRIARRRGVKVAPFKPQNMSNNAAVTPDGGEIGRAQALQAQACGLAAHVDFNPVLLKPQSDREAQIVLHGRAHALLRAERFGSAHEAFKAAIAESYARLSARFDLIVVEGAGSAAEINLRARDVANMGFARSVSAPVIIVGDIDRGGVIASLVGTHSVLDPADARLVAGFVVNKFRGDRRLFDDGRAAIVARTGWRDFGLMSWLPAAARLPSEDAVALDRRADQPSKPLIVAVPMLSRIANFDDLDPLRAEENVSVRFAPPGDALPRDADVIILPGTKSTRADLDFVRNQGWHIDIAAHARAGGHVLGLCGGYQMLGGAIEDPHGCDGAPGASQGLGLLDVTTIMRPEKRVRLTQAECAHSGAAIAGYEIHVGETHGPDAVRPFAFSAAGPHGAVSRDGRIAGTYLHGLFVNDGFRSAWIERLRPGASSGLAFAARIEAALDALADQMCADLDVDALLAAAR
jgi:adenosylcobyric acid synthase